VVEDTKVTKEDLIPLFGETVAAIVGELTFTPPEGSDVDKSLAKAKYMATFATASQSALLIKVADRLCNCMDFVQAGDIKYAKKYFDKAAPLWEALQARKDTIDEFLLADIMDDYETVLASVADDEASVIARKPSDEHAG
jgi:(p)ppGpp synthase/HD superfamily hydrolase